MREIRLGDLVEGGSLEVGDILAYKRTFHYANVTVEKDIMVRPLTKLKRSTFAA